MFLEASSLGDPDVVAPVGEMLILCSSAGICSALSPPDVLTGQDDWSIANPRVLSLSLARWNNQRAPAKSQLFLCWVRARASALNPPPSLSASPVLAPRWSVASHTRTHKHTHTLAGTLTLHHRATGCCCWHLQLRSRYSRVFNCLFTSSYLLYNRDGRASILSGWFVLPGLHCVVFMAVPLRVCVCDCVCGGIVQGERGGHRRELSMGHQLILALMFELANQTRSVAKKVRCVAPASSLAPPPPPPPPALAVGHILRHLFLLLAGHFSWLATRQIESPTPLPLPLNWQLAVDPDSDCPCPGPVLAALPAFVGSPHQTLPVSWPTDWRLAVRPAKKRARGPRTNAAFPP